MSDTSTKLDQNAWQICETIEGELRQETPGIVVSQLEVSTKAKHGYIYSEDLFFRDSLWSGEVFFKIPQRNTTDLEKTVKEIQVKLKRELCGRV